MKPTLRQKKAKDGVPAAGATLSDILFRRQLFFKTITIQKERGINWRLLNIFVHWCWAVFALTSY
jgi:hypothetical protein